LGEFISATEANAINVTNTDLTELGRLCEEFGFSKLSAKLSKYFEESQDSQRRQMGIPLAGVQSAQLRESFEFIVNESVIEPEIAEAAAYFPAVRE
jgi:hypothetical protein